ncbi:Uncharacterised protein [uncultured archaeon]|nr:Uncharacterised protein [uncultured archaeon]
MKADFEKLKVFDKNENILKAAIQVAVIKAKKSPLIEYMQKNIKKEVSIEEVRNRLAKISASLAEEVTESRAERV